MEKGANSSLPGSASSGKCEKPPKADTRRSSSGKMSPEPLIVIKGWILEPYSKRSARPKFQCLEAENGPTPVWYEAECVTSHGARSTPNIGESPSVANASFLSQILESPDDVPRKYYFSVRACRGILRRANERHKELPTPLREALEAQIKLTED